VPLAIVIPRHVAPLLPKYCATKDRIMALKEQGTEKF